jgi:dTDP-4-dehydrorhamnose 3,5-epimerase
MMFEVKKNLIPGCFELVPRKIKDERGHFVKIFHCDAFKKLGLNTDWREEYYSVSRKGVLRGLHFQLPPHDHEKLVYCVSGEVFDVIVDLRMGSPMYGRHALFQLDAVNAGMIYIPKGCAHGFYCLSDTATVMYKVSSVYSPQSDTGIRWDSLDIPWPDNNPVLSSRDAGFKPFDDFTSPFVWNR